MLCSVATTRTPFLTTGWAYTCPVTLSEESCPKLLPPPRLGLKPGWLLYHPVRVLSEELVRTSARAVSTRARTTDTDARTSASASKHAQAEWPRRRRSAGCAVNFTMIFSREEMRSLPAEGPI